jgi:hypothetical protein
MPYSLLAFATGGGDKRIRPELLGYKGGAAQAPFSMLRQ